ncbi:thioesterase II family protein [Streptomyces malaysiense]|uniref:Thioesterase n=1 Tax=Streptomyces malaysiense TaxID=1428626 RepID=A0A1J4PUC3_9ACTN|nr:alpha/beta fold hydrolase [Streptomyces malaysiense]OIK23567.1 thioesterase [Streptomyces malaysiense]
MLDLCASEWVKRHPSAGPPRLRLLCLPHAGGSAAFFHEWGRRFGDDVEVLVARYPGRHDRIGDPVITTMDELADRLCAALRGFIDVPLAIFGHSMGASLGYETALRLSRRYGFRPAALMVSGRTPPDTPDDTLPDPDDVESVLAEVRRLGGTDAAVLDDPDLRELVLPALLADFKVVSGYTPRDCVALPLPVVAYVGDADPDVDVEVVRGWARASSVDFTLKVFPGDHFYLVDQRDRLVHDVGARLAALKERGSPRSTGHTLS